MKKLPGFLLVVLICQFQSAIAQKVETIATDPLIKDGLYIDDDGTIYCGSGGLCGAKSVAKIASDGTVSPLPKQFSGSIDVTKVGNKLVVTNYDDGTIKTYDFESKQVETVTTDLNGPSGIAFDGNAVYVSQWGAPPKFDGQQIAVLDPESLKIVDRINDKRLNRPQGIVNISEDRLLVSNSQGGRIMSLNTKTKQISDFAMLGMNIVNIAYNDSLLYTANNRFHQLMVVDRDGRFMTFAGDGIPETKDGDLDDARFIHPLGVEFSRDGKYLYVAQSKDGSLRRITMPEMPETLEKRFSSTGIKLNKKGLILPKDVSAVTFFELGNEQIQTARVQVENGLIKADKFPFKKWSVAFKYGKKIYGLTN